MLGKPERIIYNANIVIRDTVLSSEEAPLLLVFHLVIELKIESYIDIGTG